MTQPPQMIQWLVRAHDLIQDVDENLPPPEQIGQFQEFNPEAFALLEPEEKKSVLKYFWPRDAAMSLVSEVLKHLIISESVGIPFSQTIISRDPKHGKPCYIPQPPSKKIVYGKTKSVSFNVSHQAELVVLIAIPESNLSDGVRGSYNVGIDVVCVNERGDLQKIMESSNPVHSYNQFIDMHAEVFSPHEIEALHIAGGSGELGGESKRMIKSGLRRFFALWCVREAWVKMTGEALLAEWLGELEFREFPVPPPIRSSSAATTENKEEDREENDEDKDDDEEMSRALIIGEETEVKQEFEIYFKSERVRNVAMRIVAVGKRYLVASAVRRKDGKPVDVPWTKLQETGIEEVIRRAKAAV